MIMKKSTQETLLCIFVGIIFSIAFIATLCGDGNKGLQDLF